MIKAVSPRKVTGPDAAFADKSRRLSRRWRRKPDAWVAGPSVTESEGEIAVDELVSVVLTYLK